MDLDLADFGTAKTGGRGNQFSTFVKNFDRGQQFLRFEEILQCVQLPDLSEDDPAKTRDLFDDLFTKLKKDFGVKRIMRLVAWDNLLRGVEDNMIAKWVNDFQVEDLDWRKLHLDLDCFSPSLPLRIIRLYSRGNWGALYFWTSDEGVLKFDTVCSYIYAQNRKACEADGTQLEEVRFDILTESNSVRRT